MSGENKEKNGMEKTEFSIPMPPQDSGMSARLILAVASAAMGSIGFGYNTGVINAPEQQIKSFMNESKFSRSGESMVDETITSLFALLVSIFCIGGVIGGLGAGWWANFFGRKFGMIFNNIIGAIAAVLMYFSRTANSYEMIIAGRLVVGIYCGLCTGLTPMYLSEVSSAKIRGALGALHQFGCVIGIMIAQILGFPEILGNADHWNLLLGLAVLPIIGQLVTMPLCPDSPRYLLMVKHREEAAREALITLRGTDDVEYEMEEMKSEAAQAAAAGKVSVLDLFRKAELRMPLIISIMMQLSQQLSGINAIFYYSVNLFKRAGLDAGTATHATSGLGATLIVMTAISIVLMDKAGRRSLHLIGLGGMFVFSIMITLSLSLTYLVEWFRVANIGMSALYVVFFSVGPGAIPWLIVSELFSQGPRPAAMSISVLVNWSANFCVGYFFPYLQDGLGDFSFLPFTVFLAIFFLFTLKFVPETKGKTIEEITSQWRTDGGGKGSLYDQNEPLNDTTRSVV